MAKNHMDELHAKVLKKFHTLCSITGKTPDEKQAIIEGYGVESSTDIQTHDLINICGALQKELDKKNGGKAAEIDTLRKQVIAAIGGWLRMQRKPENIANIKAIACRATKYAYFNQIPVERLRNIYNTFLNKQKDSRTIDELVSMAIYSQNERRQVPN